MTDPTKPLTPCTTTVTSSLAGCALPQRHTIEWHPYPAELPPRPQTVYLTTLRPLSSGGPSRVVTMRYAAHTWHGDATIVRAWAELPAAYDWGSLQ